MGCFSANPHGSPRKPKKQGSTRHGAPLDIDSSSKTHLASSAPSFQRALHSASSRLLIRHQGRALLTSSPYYSPSSLKHHLSHAGGCETPLISHSAPMDGTTTAAPSDELMVNPLFPLPLPPQSAATAGCNDDNQSADSSSSGSGSGLSALSLISSASNSMSSLPMMSPIVASTAGFKTYINPLSAPMTEEIDHPKTWLHEEPSPLPLPPPPPGSCGAALREFSFEELSGACQNFAHQFFIREGGAGPVYRAIVKDIAMSMGGLETLDVAVTRLIPAPIKQSFRKWKTEVHSLGRLSHPNLCKVIGFSADEPNHWSRHGFEQRERLLVYEHTLNGNLESCLYGKVGRAPLDWTTRLKVAMGAAQGLAYLHERAPRQIIYNSFKPINIQVDQAFNAKLSDFGFNAASKLTSNKCSKESVSASGVQEAPMELEAEGDPYAAPEMKLADCSDNEGTSVATSSNVWSFGIILLELLTGRQHMDSLFPARERDLLQWVSPIVKNSRKLFLVMDPELKGRYSTRSATMVADLALHCLSPDPLARPTMREVALVLTTSLSSSSSAPLTPPPQSSSSIPLHMDQSVYASAPLNTSSKFPINHSKSMKACSAAMSPCKQRPSSPGNNTTHTSNLLQRPRSYHLVSILATPARSFITSTPATQSSSLNGSDGCQVRDPGGGSFMGFLSGHVLSTNRVSRQVLAEKVSINSCKKAAGLESMEADHSFLSRSDAGG